MKSLSRDEMKKVKGGDAPVSGGSCCWHTSDWDSFYCDVSMQQAKDYQHVFGGNWCCASC